MTIQKFENNTSPRSNSTWKIQISDEVSFSNCESIFDVKAEFMKYISRKFDENVDNRFLVEHV